MNISIISNIILEPFLRLSIKQYFIECETKIYLIPYGEHMEQEYLTQLSVSDQIIVWLNLESLLQTFGSSTNFIKLEIKDINKVLEICEFLFSDITQIQTLKYCGFYLRIMIRKYLSQRDIYMILWLMK